MSIEYGMKDGVLLWVRNPFDGTVTYFNDIHRKPYVFRHLTRPQHVVAPAQHYYHVFRVAAEVVRRSLTNTAVKSVLIRKHQGRESGASQPHIHIQAIGADRVFPDVERDIEVTARHPQLWQECVDLMREL